MISFFELVVSCLLTGLSERHADHTQLFDWPSTDMRTPHLVLSSFQGAIPNPRCLQLLLIFVFGEGLDVVLIWQMIMSTCTHFYPTESIAIGNLFFVLLFFWTLSMVHQLQNKWIFFSDVCSLTHFCKIYLIVIWFKQNTRIGKVKVNYLFSVHDRHLIYTVNFWCRF